MGILGSLNPIAAAVGGVADLGSALIGQQASNLASRRQVAAEQQAQGQITGAYDKAQGYQQPYYDMGTQNAKTLSGMVNSNAFGTTPYNYQMGQAPSSGQFNFQTDPGYQFRQQQGTNAINSNAAAAGNQLSGATLKALNRYGQNFASNEVNNAYSRYSDTRNYNQNQYAQNTGLGMNNSMNQYNAANQQGQQQYQQYSGLAGMGMNAANNLSSMSSNYGNAMAGTMGDIGNAQAAGTMGQANAWGGALNNIGGMAMLSAMPQQQYYTPQGAAQNAYNQTPYGQAANNFFGK